MKILDLIKKNKVLFNIGILVLGIFLGWLFFGNSGSDNTDGINATEQNADNQVKTIWTCSMHPQIREDEPGKCPICGMDLVPLESDEGTADDGSRFTIKLSDAAMKIAEVQTSRIRRMSPYKEVRLPGKVMPDERNIAELTSRFPGRIEKLNINFTGQKVKKGQVLGSIYSPELVTAQRELFEAMKFRETNPNYYTAARNKLKLWDLTEGQINEIETSGEVKFYFDILSPISGTVTMRHVALGDYVKEGSPLFEVINLSHVWVIFDAYESDIPWVKVGDKITFTIKSIPGKDFTGNVTFIDPVLDPKSRVAGIRTELNNPGDLLKPQMLASGILTAVLPGSGEELVVPKSSVLWTGKRAIAYVMTNDQENMFQYREIQLGAEAGDYYVLEGGLKEGELVATNGVFKIDAAAQLKGENSMMNPEGGEVPVTHDHGDMSGQIKPVSNIESKKNNQDVPVQQESMVDEKFKIQLTEVYRAQLDLLEALIASDPDAAKRPLENIDQALQKVDMGLVKGNMHEHWMQSLNKLKESLESMKEADDIEGQRSGYSDFSDALYSAIKMFGTEGETIYYQFCPMANDSKGAYWLSDHKEIENPYYGEMMLTCGETKEIITSK